MMQPLRHDQTAGRDATSRVMPRFPDRTIRFPSNLGEKFHRMAVDRKSQQFHFIAQFRQPPGFGASCRQIRPPRFQKQSLTRNPRSQGAQFPEKFGARSAEPIERPRT